MNSNKKTGTAFEQEFAKWLHGKGYWVHLFQQNRNGQPCDLIAVKNGDAYLIDCKECQGPAFELRRMEENQINAMLAFEEAGNREGIFAIRFANGHVYNIDRKTLGYLRDDGLSQVTEEDLSAIYDMVCDLSKGGSV